MTSKQCVPLENVNSEFGLRIYLSKHWQQTWILLSIIMKPKNKSHLSHGCLFYSFLYDMYMCTFLESGRSTLGRKIKSNLKILYYGIIMELNVYILTWVYILIILPKWDFLCSLYISCIFWQKCVKIYWCVTDGCGMENIGALKQEKELIWIKTYEWQLSWIWFVLLNYVERINIFLFSCT